MRVLVPVPSALLGRLDALGLDVEHLLRESGVLRSRFQGPRAQVTVSGELPGLAFAGSSPGTGEAPRGASGASRRPSPPVARPLIQRSEARAR
jgi:hypothetical protein